MCQARVRMAANRFPSVAGPSSREEIVSSLISRKYKQLRGANSSAYLCLVDSLQFSMDEILSATDNLNKLNELGKGGYGSVFLANNLRCAGTTAAVKVLSMVDSMINFLVLLIN